MTGSRSRQLDRPKVILDHDDTSPVCEAMIDRYIRKFGHRCEVAELRNGCQFTIGQALRPSLAHMACLEPQPTFRPATKIRVEAETCRHDGLGAIGEDEGDRTSFLSQADALLCTIGPRPACDFLWPCLGTQSLPFMRQNAVVLAYLLQHPSVLPSEAVNSRGLTGKFAGSFTRLPIQEKRPPAMRFANGTSGKEADNSGSRHRGGRGRRISALSYDNEASRPPGSGRTASL